MNCPSCDNHGVFEVRYHDGSPTEYAVCLCPAGEALRLATNHGKPVAPQWVLWAVTRGIDPGRVAPMEDLLTPEELASRGFAEITAPASAMDAIAAAARARKRP